MTDQAVSETPTKLSDLKPGLRLSGKVTRVELAGAFVDVGAEREGFVHISMLAPKAPHRVEDVVHPGQEVTVWVRKVDPAAGRLELSMVRPVLYRWGDLKPGMRLKGEVVRLEKFGAFVDIGAPRPGLVHVSEMSDEYVNDPRSLVKVGDEVEVTVLEVDRKKRQIRLSMKDQEEESHQAADQEPERIPTAMEVALRQALEARERREAAARREREEQARRREREAQEEILARTLQQRVKATSANEEA